MILYILERSFFGEMLTKSDIAGGSSKFVTLMFIFARTEDLSCRYFKNSLLPMPNSWANCGNVVNVLRFENMVNVGDTLFSPCAKIQYFFFIAYKVTVVPQWGEVRWS